MSFAVRGALAALVFLATNCGSASAQSLLEFTERAGVSGNWRIGYSRALSGCIAATSYGDNTTLWIGYSVRFDYFVAFSNPSWGSIDDDSKYSLFMRLDSDAKWQGEFSGIKRGTEKGLIKSGLKEEFINDLAKADAISLNSNQKQITRLSLSGSRAAINEVTRCIRDRSEQAKLDAKDSQSKNAPKERGSSSGTGFFVSAKGHVVTNHHVVKDCKTFTVSQIGRLAEPAKVLAADEKNDLALLTTELKPPRVPAFRTRVRVGEPIFVYGFPLTNILTTTGNFTTGNVTAIAGVGDDTSHLQISAPVQPGNSGGPLVDKSGNIIGVIVSRLKGDLAQNANFAIKSSIAANFLETNGLQPPEPSAQADKELDSADVADRLREFTVRVVCQ